MKNVILFGLKNVGKTTLGKRLSSLINYNFVDIDSLIEKIYLAQFNQPLTYKEIYNLKGEPFFREMEKKVLCSLYSNSKSVVSLGGGTAAQVSLHPILKKLGDLIYLKVNLETFIKLNSKEASSPLFNGSLKTYFEERTAIFDYLNAKVINLDNRQEDEVIEEIVDAIK